MALQYLYNPLDYTFKWVRQPDGWWYEWDRLLAHRQALAARNRAAKQLKAQGYRVVKSTLTNQLISRGGIGTDRPHIDHWVNVYILDATREE